MGVSSKTSSMNEGALSFRQIFFGQYNGSLVTSKIYIHGVPRPPLVLFSFVIDEDVPIHQD